MPFDKGRATIMPEYTISGKLYKMLYFQSDMEKMVFSSHVFVN